MDSKKSQKVAKIFSCICCNYSTSKKHDYIKHIATPKHQKSANDSKMVVNDSKNSQKVAKIYKCNCGKMYKYDTGYYRHKKTCNVCEDNYNNEDTIKINKETTDKELIMLLIKENVEMKNMMMEVIKNGTHNNSNNNTNSHNKSFNLQFFLNETCKDAMNIMDFVESIQLQLSDLEKVGEIGYVEGISNIIVKNLKALDVTQRPVHCTDKKREVLYVKDEDKWEKQDEDNTKLRKVIKKVTDKNMRLIPKYREKYPDCNKSISRYSDQYNKIVVESMGGSGDNDHEKATKIIKNISKQVIVEKEQEADVL